jgi:hypothetical protein
MLASTCIQFWKGFSANLYCAANFVLVVLFRPSNIIDKVPKDLKVCCAPATDLKVVVHDLTFNNPGCLVRQSLDM